MGTLVCAEEIPRDERGCSPSEELGRVFILVFPPTPPQLWEGSQAEAPRKTCPSLRVWMISRLVAGTHIWVSRQLGGDGGGQKFFSVFFFDF